MNGNIGGVFDFSDGVKFTVSYESVRGYGHDGTVTHDNRSPYLHIKYNINIYTKSGSWYSYPIYISGIDTDNETPAFGGTLIKPKGERTFNRTHHTGWTYVTTDSSQIYVQISLSDSRGKLKRTGQHLINVEGQNKIPEYQPPVVKIGDDTSNPAIELINSSRIKVRWKHMSGDTPTHIDYRVNNGYWNRNDATNPFLVDLEPNKEYNIQIRGVRQGQTEGTGSNYLNFRTVDFPRIEAGQTVIVSESKNSKIKVINSGNHNCTFNIAGIERSFTGSENTLSLNMNEIDILKKYTDGSVDATLKTTINGTIYTDTKRIDVRTDGNIRTIKIKKETAIKNGKIFIKKDGIIRHGIIWTKKDGLLRRGI